MESLTWSEDARSEPLGLGRVMDEIWPPLRHWLWLRLVSDEYFISRTCPLFIHDGETRGPQLARELRLAQPYDRPRFKEDVPAGVKFRCGYIIAYRVGCRTAITNKIDDGPLNVNPSFFPHPTPADLGSQKLHVLLDATDPGRAHWRVTVLQGDPPYDKPPAFLSDELVVRLPSGKGSVRHAGGTPPPEEPLAQTNYLSLDMMSMIESMMAWAARPSTGAMALLTGESGELNHASWEVQGFLVCYLTSHIREVGRVTFRVRRRREMGYNQEYVILPHWQPPPPPPVPTARPLNPFSAAQVFQCFKHDQEAIYIPFFQLYDHML
ncbi:hypothetical protein RB596_007480 [Gaeumannomyces avenae]